MGAKTNNSAAGQAAIWHNFIGDRCPDGIMDNHPAFKDKRHTDSVQSAAYIGRKRALSHRQKSDASRLDNRAHWFGTINAIVYFAGNIYAVVYSYTYYLFEVRRGEGAGKEVRTGLSGLQATGADVYPEIG